MGYLDSTSRCKCDYCNRTVEIPLDGPTFTGATFAKELAERMTEMRYSDFGGFYLGGDVYACGDCIERAQDSLVEREGFDALVGDAVYHELEDLFDEQGDD